MFVDAAFLRDVPDIAVFIYATGKAELLFCDEVDHFIGWQKIVAIKIDPAVPVPDNDLPDREFAVNGSNAEAGTLRGMPFGTETFMVAILDSEFRMRSM